MRSREPLTCLAGRRWAPAPCGRPHPRDSEAEGDPGGLSRRWDPAPSGAAEGVLDVRPLFRLGKCQERGRGEARTASTPTETAGLWLERTQPGPLYPLQVGHGRSHRWPRKRLRDWTRRAEESARETPAGAGRIGAEAPASERAGSRTPDALEDSVAVGEATPRGRVCAEVRKTQEVCANNGRPVRGAG